MVRLLVRLTLCAAACALLLAPAADAQSFNIWTPKFVCGFQTGNVPLLNNAHPQLSNSEYEDFKPGNYATTVNLLNASLLTRTVGGFAVLMVDDPTGVTTSISVALPNIVLNPIIPPAGTPLISQGADIDCQDIVNAFPPGLQPNPAGSLIEGYVVLFLLDGGLGLKVDSVSTFESQNAFERHRLWTLDFSGQVRIALDLLGLSLQSITTPFLPGVVFEGGEIAQIAASGAGGLGLGASIEIEQWDPSPVDLSVIPGGAEAALKRIQQGLGIE